MRQQVDAFAFLALDGDSDRHKGEDSINFLARSPIATGKLVGEIRLDEKVDPRSRMAISYR